MCSEEQNMVHDTEGKAEASNTAHDSRECAQRTDIQMLSVLHTPLPSMDAGEYPGCMGYGHCIRYFGAQQSWFLRNQQ